MICENQECKKEFEPDPKYPRTKYCCHECRDRVRVIRGCEAKRRKTAERRARGETPHHPCRRCGKPADYGCLYCPDCRKLSYYERKGQGIAPLRTPAIRASRVREQEAIDRVVAKAKANGTVGSIDFWNDRQLAGRRIHATKVG